MIKLMMGKQFSPVRKINLRIGVLVCAALLALLPAVMPQPSDAASPASNPNQAANVLRVGYLGQGTSPTATGAQLALDQINSIGGVTAADGVTYQIELLSLSATPNAGNLSAAVDALVAQNVIALLGPSQDALLTSENISVLVNTGLPVLTPSGLNGLTESDADDVFFRIAAPNYVYSLALAAHLVDDLDLNSIALLQTDVVHTEALLDFEDQLRLRSITPAAMLPLGDNMNLLAEVEPLLEVNPEAVVMWGAPADAATVLEFLRDSGWEGIFAYRHADEAVRSGVIPVSLGAGMVGVANWNYAYGSSASRVFLEDYLVAFGEVPGAYTAAGYDAMWMLRAALRDRGPSAQQLRGGLLAASTLPLVQGNLQPSIYGTGDIVRSAYVYEILPGGGARVVAYFEDTTRQPLADAGS